MSSRNSGVKYGVSRIALCWRDAPLSHVKSPNAKGSEGFSSLGASVSDGMGATGGAKVGGGGGGGAACAAGAEAAGVAEASTCTCARARVVAKSAPPTTPRDDQPWA